MSVKYSNEHEWIRVEGDVGTVGISQYAQEQLGDVVFVDVPQAGRAFRKDIAARRGIKTRVLDGAGLSPLVPEIDVPPFERRVDPRCKQAVLVRMVDGELVRHDFSGRRPDRMDVPAATIDRVHPRGWINGREVVLQDVLSIHRNRQDMIGVYAGDRRGAGNLRQTPRLQAIAARCSGRQRFVEDEHSPGWISRQLLQIHLGARVFAEECDTRRRTE